MNAAVYLDYNATTPVHPDVVSAMLPYFAERFGNPSSAHIYGYQGLSAAEAARRQVAAFLGASPSDVIFTSGGSDGDNFAIKGTVFARHGRSPHVVTTSIEHSAVLNTLTYLQSRFGATFSAVPVDMYGMVDPEDVLRAVRPETVLITVMHANNEVGTIQPIVELASIAHARGITLHVDAAQSAGKVDLRTVTSAASVLTVSGHKLYGPKGIGAAYVRPGTSIDPLVHGSGQEHGLRAGTEPVASMVGLGTACAIAADDLEDEGVRLTHLRDLLLERLRQSVPGVQLNGHPSDRLPNTLNVSFPGVAGAQLLAACPEVCASTGSACHAASAEPSSVLLAMGLGFERALGAVRLSLGRWTTAGDVDRATAALCAAYRSLAGPRANVV